MGRGQGIGGKKDGETVMVRNKTAVKANLSFPCIYMVTECGRLAKDRDTQSKLTNATSVVLWIDVLNGRDC